MFPSYKQKICTIQSQFLFLRWNFDKKRHIILFAQSPSELPPRQERAYQCTIEVYASVRRFLMVH